MKKTFKRTLSIALTLVFLLGFSVIPALADDESTGGEGTVVNLETTSGDVTEGTTVGGDGTEGDGDGTEGDSDGIEGDGDGIEGDGDGDETGESAPNPGVGSSTITISDFTLFSNGWGQVKDTTFSITGNKGGSKVIASGEGWSIWIEPDNNGPWVIYAQGDLPKGGVEFDIYAQFGSKGKTSIHKATVTVTGEGSKNIVDYFGTGDNSINEVQVTEATIGEYEGDDDGDITEGDDDGDITEGDDDGDITEGDDDGDITEGDDDADGDADTGDNGYNGGGSRGIVSTSSNSGGAVEIADAPTPLTTIYEEAPPLVSAPSVVSDIEEEIVPLAEMPQTGTDNSLIPWIIGMFASMIMGFVLLRGIRKQYGTQA